MPRLSLFYKDAAFDCEGPELFIVSERSRFMDDLIAKEKSQSEEIVVTLSKQVPPRDRSWDMVLPMIKSGRLDLAVGDAIECTLDDGRPVDFVVTEDTGDALRFESRDCLGDYVCRDKVDAYFEKVFAAMPKSLQDAIIDTERPYLDADGKRCVETKKLFLPAASEIFDPEDCCGDKGLYQRLDWYKDFHNRIRGIRKGAETPDWYWTASRYSGTATYWCCVNNAGLAGSSGASGTSFAAPVCFRILKS